LLTAAYLNLQYKIGLPYKHHKKKGYFPLIGHKRGDMQEKRGLKLKILLNGKLVL